MLLNLINFNNFLQKCRFMDLQDNKPMSNHCPNFATPQGSAFGAGDSCATLHTGDLQSTDFHEKMSPLLPAFPVQGGAFFHPPKSPRILLWGGLSLPRTGGGGIFSWKSVDVVCCNRALWHN